MIEVIFYILIFCIGTVFGSFFTLAVYRIPLHQDITHEHSYCPNCKHKLGFWDMIPILSYIFLGGKCRYCKKKIRIRYLMLEIFAGIVFLLFAMSLNLSFVSIKINEMINLGIFYLFLAGIIIIAGIDKEKRIIQKELLLYEILIQGIYMVYLCIVEEANIYRYAIYLSIMVILLIIENTYLRRKLENNYTIEILELSLILIMFVGEKAYVASVILTLLSIAIECIEKKLIDFKHKENKQKVSYYKNLPIGFYLICSNIISLIIMNFISM